MNASVLGRTLLAIAALSSVLVVTYFAGETRILQSELLPETAALAGVEWEFDRYKDYFIELSQKKGALYAFDVLRQAPFPPEIHVHSLGHHIGYRLYEEKGIAGLADCTDEFQNACAHAVLTQAFIYEGQSILGRIAQVCASAPTKSGYSMCFHGVGHGIMAYTGYDYEESVTRCRELYQSVAGSDAQATPENTWYECIGGATMELSLGEHDVEARARAQEIYMPVADVYMPCDAPFLDPEIRPECYSYISSRFFIASGATPGVPSPGTYAEALGYCDRIPDADPATRAGCYGGFGPEFVYFASINDKDFSTMPDDAMRDVHTWCGLAADAAGTAACIQYALSTIFWGGFTDASAPARFCALASDPTVEDACYRGLASELTYLYQEPAERSRACEILPDAYQAYCDASS